MIKHLKGDKNKKIKRDITTITGNITTGTQYEDKGITIIAKYRRLLEL